MKILQLCKKVPWPSKDGESIAISSITQNLLEKGHHVTLLTMSTSKHSLDKEATLPENDKFAFHHVNVDTSINAMDAFLNLFSAQSYNIQRFDSATYRAKLIELLQNESFDFIHLEGLYLCLYLDTIRKYTKAKVSLRGHNVEHEIWERLAQNEKSFIKKAYLKLLTKRLKSYELKQLSKIDLLVPITQKDLDCFHILGYKGKHYVLPGGVGHVGDSGTNGGAFKCFFLGSMDWMPNQEGVNWLMKEIWPKVIAKAEQAELFIAGRNFEKAAFDHKEKGIKVIGEVKSADAYMSDKAIMIVPLLSGSGMRIKIIEAMSKGKVVITTKVGAEGITYENGKDILIADDATHFANQIIRCLGNEDMIKQIGDNAIKTVEKYYLNNKLVEGLIDFYQSNN